MYLEALIKLADIIDHFEKKNEVLISDQYHKDARELIEFLSKSLATDLEFKSKDPGPYSFGFGELQLNIFSPDQTNKQEWAALARFKNGQKNYRFNSIMGLIKILISTVKEINNEDKSDPLKKED